MLASIAQSYSMMM